jgi:hypothetical protein
MVVSRSTIPINVHIIHEVPKDNSIPSARKIKKTELDSIKKQYRALGFGIICGMLSFGNIPQRQRSLFFDVRLVCGQRHLGIEKGFWLLLAYKSDKPSRR